MKFRFVPGERASKVAREKGGVQFYGVRKRREAALKGGGVGEGSGGIGGEGGSGVGGVVGDLSGGGGEFGDGGCSVGGVEGGGGGGC